MKRRSGVPSMREASITAGSIDRTPVKLLIVAGTNAANQITRTFAASPSPSHRIVSGIQASGGIGRISRKTGLMRASARRLQPIRSPSGTPVRAATANPSATSFRLCTTWSCRTPLAYPVTATWRNDTHMSRGDGKRPGEMRASGTVARYQTAASVASVAKPMIERRPILLIAPPAAESSERPAHPHCDPKALDRLFQAAESPPIADTAAQPARAKLGHRHERDDSEEDRRDALGLEGLHCALEVKPHTPTAEEPDYRGGPERDVPGVNRDADEGDPHLRDDAVLEHLQRTGTRGP